MTSKKRTIVDLSPESLSENKAAKKVAMEGLDIKKMFEECQRLLTTVEKNLETKIENLPTKQDFAVFTKEITALKEENLLLKQKIEKLEKEGTEDRIRLERIENYYRRKNLIISGLKIGEAPRKAAQDLLNGVLGIQGDAGIQQVKPLKQNERSQVVLVEFNSVTDVDTVLANTKKLRSTKISVERDLTEEARERKKALLKIKKIIRNKVMSEDDKKRRIRVNADVLRIETTNFYWRNNKLMCGKGEATRELNKIFNYNFINTDFLNEISILDSQNNVHGRNIK